MLTNSPLDIFKQFYSTCLVIVSSEMAHGNLKISVNLGLRKLILGQPLGVCK